MVKKDLKEKLLNKFMTNKPLTLQLLKKYNVPIGDSVVRLIKNESKSFTPEELEKGNISTSEIVMIVCAYLKINRKEYQGRLLLCKMLEPCVKIFAKAELNKNNVVQHIIDILKEENLDKEKLASAEASAWDSAWACAWTCARDCARASAEASARACAWASAEASAWDSARACARASAEASAWDSARASAEAFQMKLCIKFFNINFDFEIKKESSEFSTLHVNSKIEEESIFMTTNNDILEMVRIGKNLRSLRTLYDFSQHEIAKKLDITFQQYQKYETGKNAISIPKIMLICKFYQSQGLTNLSLDDLLNIDIKEKILNLLTNK